MKREIYEVYAKIVDANGAYNTLNGYPKVFDSHTQNDDLEKARKRAYAEYWDVLGAMGKRDDRQQQIAMIIRASDGMQIEKMALGKIFDLPDPTYVVTVTNGSGGGSYKENETVTISADAPEEGKMFSAWTGADNLVFIYGNANTSSAAFRMPAEAVTLEATYVDIPTYEVTVENGSGSGTYEEDEPVTIVANEPEEGKVFSTWVGADNLVFIDGNASTAFAVFRMPAEAVALEATYADAPPEPEPEPEPNEGE